MKKIISLFLIFTLAMSTIPVSANYFTELASKDAESVITVDYANIYLSYAKNADINPGNELNDAVSGLILLDLNMDNVPELLAFSRSTSHYDKDGNKLYISDENYDNPAYIQHEYTLEKGFSIVDNTIRVETPWDKVYYGDALNMPFLPGCDNENSEGFCTIVRYNRGREDYLAMCKDSSTGKAFSVLWYDENGFGYSREGYDEHFFDVFYEVKLPVASITFYDYETQTKHTRNEAMKILLDEYSKQQSKSTDNK